MRARICERERKIVLTPSTGEKPILLKMFEHMGVPTSVSQLEVLAALGREGKKSPLPRHRFRAFSPSTNGGEFALLPKKRTLRLMVMRLQEAGTSLILRVVNLASDDFAGATIPIRREEIDIVVPLLCFPEECRI